MESIFIKKVLAKKTKLVIELEVSNGIQKYIKEKSFFCDFSFEVESIPRSILVIPALLNLLQLSWITNSVLWVDEVDEDFYKSVYELKNAFRELHPCINLGGTFIAARRIKNVYQSSDLNIQLFTGGIDATTTMIRHIDENLVLFNTNGWFKKSPQEPNEVFGADYAAINQIANSSNLKAQFVKSNFGTFISARDVDKDFLNKKHTTWWFGFQHSLAFIGCAAVAGYYYRANMIYIASSYTFGQYIVCVSDPRIDPCVRCAGIRVIHDGYELSRQDKVLLIKNYQESIRKAIKLRVCSFNTHNCCSCEKCFRSMLALVAEGVKDVADFGFEMDEPLLSKLKRFIDTNAMELDHDHIVFWYEIIARMKENYDSLYYKDVYDYLKKIDLYKAKKNAVWKHYRNDFFSIFKRKLNFSNTLFPL